MTTEAGVERPDKVRKRIETLRQRLEFIEGRAAARSAAGLDSSFDEAEAKALKWALPVLEAEWHYAVRFEQQGLGILGRKKRKSQA